MTVQVVHLSVWSPPCTTVHVIQPVSLVTNVHDSTGSTHISLVTTVHDRQVVQPISLVTTMHDSTGDTTCQSGHHHA